MSEIDFKALGNNPLIKTINDLIQGKADEIGVGFDHLLSGSDDSFHMRMAIISELFEEAQNSIESISGIPINPFVDTFFRSWIRSIDLESIRQSIQKEYTGDKSKEAPQFLLVRSQVQISKQPEGKSYELEVRLCLVHKDDSGENAWTIPIIGHTFVLSRYIGNMKNR